MQLLVIQFLSGAILSGIALFGVGTLSGAIVSDTYNLSSAILSGVTLIIATVSGASGLCESGPTVGVSDLEKVHLKFQTF